MIANFYIFAVDANRNFGSRKNRNRREFVLQFFKIRMRILISIIFLEIHIFHHFFWKFTLRQSQFTHEFQKKTRYDSENFFLNHKMIESAKVRSQSSSSPPAYTVASISKFLIYQ